MKKNILLLAFAVVLASQAAAVCPVCTVAVGVGVGFMRYLGVDDVITGLWYGGFIVSSILWTVDWLSKKGRKFKYMTACVGALYMLLFVAPLYYPMRLIGLEGNVLFGVDRLLFGIVEGMVVFILAVLSEKHLRNLNNGKRVFPGQKVVVPVVYLILSSVIMWLIVGILR